MKSTHAFTLALAALFIITAVISPAAATPNKSGVAHGTGPDATVYQQYEIEENESSADEVSESALIHEIRSQADEDLESVVGHDYELAVTTGNINNTEPAEGTRAEVDDEIEAAVNRNVSVQFVFRSESQESDQGSGLRDLYTISEEPESRTVANPDIIRVTVESPETESDKSSYTGITP